MASTARMANFTVAELARELDVSEVVVQRIVFDQIDELGFAETCVEAHSTDDPDESGTGLAIVLREVTVTAVRDHIASRYGRDGYPRP